MNEIEEYDLIEMLNNSHSYRLVAILESLIDNAGR